MFQYLIITLPILVPKSSIEMAIRNSSAFSMGTDKRGKSILAYHRNIKWGRIVTVLQHCNRMAYIREQSSLQAKIRSKCLVLDSIPLQYSCQREKSIHHGLYLKMKGPKSFQLPFRAQEIILCHLKQAKLLNILWV